MLAAGEMLWTPCTATSSPNRFILSIMFHSDTVLILAGANALNYKPRSLILLSELASCSSLEQHKAEVL